jgi:hypothetical protein
VISLEGVAGHQSPPPPHIYNHNHHHHIHHHHHHHRRRHRHLRGLVGGLLLMRVEAEDLVPQVRRRRQPTAVLGGPVHA